MAQSEDEGDHLQSDDTFHNKGEPSAEGEVSIKKNQDYVTVRVVVLLIETRSYLFIHD